MSITTISAPRVRGTRRRASVAALATIGATLAFLAPTTPASAADFFAVSGIGNIPNSDPVVGRTVSFNVAGVSAPIRDVKISMTLTHGAVGELTAKLIAPNGATATIFDAAAIQSFNDISATVEFSDGAAAVPSWLQAEATNPVPAGTYRASDNTGVQTLITPSFAGVTDPTGTWKLVLFDVGGADTGSVSAARLSLNSATCGGLAATTGTPGDDVIVGTTGNDVIAAGAGNDIVRGLGGNDVICGEAGNDKLKGGAGKDKCFGGPGKDVFKKCEKAKQN